MDTRHLFESPHTLYMDCPEGEHVGEVADMEPEADVTLEDDTLYDADDTGGEGVNKEWECKFEFIEDDTKEIDGHTLHRIKCITEFCNQEETIHVGEVGGYVEKRENLSDNAWVYDNAMVYGDAVILNSASVKDNAVVYGSVVVDDRAFISGNAKVLADNINDKIIVTDNSTITGDAGVMGKVVIAHNAFITGNAVIKGDGVEIKGDAQILDNVQIVSQARIRGNTIIRGNAIIAGDAHIRGGHIQGRPFFGDGCYISEGTRDYIVFENVGSRLDVLTVYKTKYGGVRISTGCFLGSIDEFKKAVEKEHEKNEKIKKEYFYIIDIIKNRFDL